VRTETIEVLTVALRGAKRAGGSRIAHDFNRMTSQYTGEANEYSVLTRALPRQENPYYKDIFLLEEKAERLS
jgi:hypothetical protein